MATLQKEKEDKKSGGKASADIRLTMDIAEIDLTGSRTSFEQVDPENPRVLLLTLRPSEGYYSGGTFKFRVTVPFDYPHQPPKVTYCLNDNPYRLYHPNIDEDGKVCLNILRAEWRPVLTLKSVIFGMELLFSEPNPDDPLNKKAAKMLREDVRGFARTVTAWMQGNYI